MASQFPRNDRWLSTPMMKPDQTLLAAATDPDKALMLALWRDRDAIPIPIPGNWDLSMYSFVTVLCGTSVIVCPAELSECYLFGICLLFVHF
jgi:hypothetical protein